MSRRRSRDRWVGPHGLVCVDKPVGPTSFAVMRQVQSAVDVGRAGHGGTLDPAASGVLLVLVGEGTKLSPWVMRWDKTYRARVRFGVATNTFDVEGVAVERSEVPPGALTPARLEAALAEFVGEKLQSPPAYSAIKVDGRSLMSRARAGEAVDPEPRLVRCDGLELLSIDGDDVEVRLHVGKGYYVRSFARDLGLAMGLPAHLAGLRRERVGPFHVDAAVSLDDAGASTVLPLEASVPDVPTRRLDAEDTLAIVQGRRIAAAPAEAEVMLLSPEGKPLAMAGPDEAGQLAVIRGFALDPPPPPRAVAPGHSTVDNDPNAD